MPRLDQSRTKSAYGLQWNQFRIIRPEEDRATFRNRTGLSSEPTSKTRSFSTRAAAWAGTCGLPPNRPPA